MASQAYKISSFTTVGHILHINLKEALLSQKHQIGEALLTKNPRALAVVNKVNTIDNSYRNFDIEVIAKRQGCDKTDEELMICEVNENKCRFRLDFSKVYWNSRLSTEHERIINKFNKNHDIVFDLFAGVGPFSVPAAKSKCKTYANDLNPEAFRWLEINMKRNKVREEFYEIFNLDAREFIIGPFKTKLVEEYERIKEEDSSIKPKVHILMNLPAIAATFLPYFVGLLRNVTRVSTSSFKELDVDHIVYCYTFLKGTFDDPKAEVRSIVEDSLGFKLDDSQLLEIFRVRNVAPSKEMYRVVFKLDESILFRASSIKK